MAVIKKDNLISEVKTIIIRFDKDNKDVDNIDFIIDRFLHYLHQALLHGRTVIIPTKVHISLVYTHINSILASARKKLQITKKIFGYHFHVAVETKVMKEQCYSFRTDKKLLDKISESIENDNIYKLVRK